MTTRRGFLQACLALAAAPAIVRADSLMRIIPRGATILLPNHVLWGDGIHDDTAALQAYMDGKRVLQSDGSEFAGLMRGATCRISNTIILGSNKILSGGTLHMPNHEGRHFLDASPNIENVVLEHLTLNGAMQL